MGPFLGLCACLTTRSSVRDPAPPCLSTRVPLCDLPGLRTQRHAVVPLSPAGLHSEYLSSRLWPRLSSLGGDVPECRLTCPTHSASHMSVRVWGLRGSAVTPERPSVCALLSAESLLSSRAPIFGPMSEFPRVRGHICTHLGIF